jgi:spore germination protein GerM
MTARVGHARRARRAALAAVVVATLVGCGVPVDTRPRDIASRDLPQVGDVTPVPGANAPTGSPLIFLVRSDATLAAVRRDVPSTARTVLDELLKGPSKDDLAEKRSSSIPAGITVLDVNQSQPETLTVELRQAEDSTGFQASQGITALAQIVFTLTALPCVTGLSFTINGEPRRLPDEKGTPQARPLTRADFASFKPRFAADEARRIATQCN